MGSLCPHNDMLTGYAKFFKMGHSRASDDVKSCVSVLFRRIITKLKQLRGYDETLFHEMTFPPLIASLVNHLRLILFLGPNAHSKCKFSGVLGWTLPRHLYRSGTPRNAPICYVQMRDGFLWLYTCDMPIKSPAKPIYV